MCVLATDEVMGILLEVRDRVASYWTRWVYMLPSHDGITLLTL